MDKEKIRAELDAFIESGKAKVEVNSGNFVTTHIDMLKIAEHFYKQALKGVKECIDKRYELHRPEYLKTRSSYLEGVLDGIDTIEQDVDELAEK